MNRLSMISVASVAAMVLFQGCSGKKPAEEPVEKLPEVETAAVTPAPTPDAKTTPRICCGETYIIKKGETLSAVAAAKGLRWQDIVASNPGLNPNRLRVGQAIQLPVMPANVKPVVKPAAKTVKKAVTPADMTAPMVPSYKGATEVYTVKKGDSLGLIAVKNKTTVAKLRAANPSLKGDLIRVGQKLKIPTAKVKAGCDGEQLSAAGRPSAAGATAVATPAQKQDVAANPDSVKNGGEQEGTPRPLTISDTNVAEKLPSEGLKPAPDEVKPAVQKAEKIEQKAGAAAAEVEAKAAECKTYTVKDGEDVYAVAIRWSVSPIELKKLNGLETSELHAGQVLKIPSDVH